MRVLMLVLSLALLGCGPARPAATKSAAEPDVIDRTVHTVVKLALLAKVAQPYRQALASGQPPRSLADLAVEGGPPRTPRGNKEPFVVRYGVNPAKLPDGGAGHALAWEHVADQFGGRVVLMADLTTVRYLKEAEFASTPKAGP